MARSFGASWWGSAWLDAIETKALTDEGRLSRGRTYARRQRVHDLEVQPGLVAASVEGTDPYSAQLGVRRLSESAWATLLDLITDRAAYAAALVTGELPESLCDAAEAAGVSILPGPGDLVPDCTCPDWGEPCKHVAAMCYLLTDLIDDDPFILLMLRGRGRDELLTELRSRRSGSDAVDQTNDEPRGMDPGTPALDAHRRTPGELPRLRPVRRMPGAPIHLGVTPPADSGLDLGELASLVSDAVERATAMLQGVGDAALALSVDADLARRAAAAIDAPSPSGPARRPRGRSTADALDDLAVSTGLDVATLEAAAVAWRHGGEQGLAVTDERWEPDPSLLDSGAATLAGRVRRSANRVTAGRRQLRLDRSGRWWPFVAHEELGWVLAGPGFLDPVDVGFDEE